MSSGKKKEYTIIFGNNDKKENFKYLASISKSRIMH